MRYFFHGQTDRQTDWQTDKQTDRQTDQQTDWQTDRPTFGLVEALSRSLKRNCIIRVTPSGKVEGFRIECTCFTVLKHLSVCHIVGTKMLIPKFQSQHLWIYGHITLTLFYQHRPASRNMLRPGKFWWRIFFIWFMNHYILWSYFYYHFHIPQTSISIVYSF